MPSDPVDVALVAEQVIGVGRADEATRMLREALAEHPDSALLLGQLARSLRAGGDLPGAEQAARAAIAIAPQWTLPMLTLGLLLVQTNRADEAAAVASTVIAMEPEAAGAHALLALCGAGRRREQDRAIARGAYRHAIALDPQDPQLRAFGAVVEHSFGATWDARRLVEEGLAIDPQSTQLLSLRAEYAPVAEQPALLVDVLTANPRDDEARELLDAAVTWERRLALIPVLTVPAVVAALRFGYEPGGTIGVAIAGVVLGAVLLLRERRRRRLLPAGYRASRRTAAGIGAPVSGALTGLTALLVLAGAVLSAVAPPLAAPLLTASVVAGAAAVLALLPDAQRVLATSRRRRGRARGSAAARYGGLRNEAALWTAPPLAILGVAVLFNAAPVEPVPAGWFAVAVGSVLVLLLAESFAASLNAFRLPVLGVLTYRGLVAGAFTAVLVVAGLAALGGGHFDRPSSDDDDGVSVTPIRMPSASFSIPDFSFSVPSITVPSP